jgi:hypothetical protein
VGSTCQVILLIIFIFSYITESLTCGVYMSAGIFFNEWLTGGVHMSARINKNVCPFFNGAEADNRGPQVRNSIRELNSAAGSRSRDVGLTGRVCLPLGRGRERDKE